MKVAILLAALAMGCGGISDLEPEAATTIGWDSERGLIVTTGQTASVGVPVRIGEVVPPCTIENFVTVNDVQLVASIEYAPGPDTWTIVATFEPGADLPAGTTITHRLLDRENPGVLVRPFSAWVEIAGRIQTRREW